MGTRIARVWECDTCTGVLVGESGPMLESAAPSTPTNWWQVVGDDSRTMPLAFCSGECLLSFVEKQVTTQTAVSA